MKVYVLHAKLSDSNTRFAKTVVDMTDMPFPTDWVYAAVMNNTIPTEHQENIKKILGGDYEWFSKYVIQYKYELVPFSLIR